MESNGSLAPGDRRSPGVGTGRWCGSTPRSLAAVDRSIGLVRAGRESLPIPEVGRRPIEVGRPPVKVGRSQREVWLPLVDVDGMLVEAGGVPVEVGRSLVEVGWVRSMSAGRRPESVDRYPIPLGRSRR